MAEKEYIEREAAYKACEAYFSGVCVYDVSESEVINDFEKVIDAVPTADVAPVRHGRWIYNPNGMDFNLGAWECSVCTQKNNNLPCNRNISPYICVGSKYCPNCGAKMGGEGE